MVCPAEICTSGGRPTGTTASKGFAVGTSGGRPTGSIRPVNLEDLNLPSEWDSSAVNLSQDLLRTCNHRVSQQKAFDKKPLGVGVCYCCGHILWTSAGGGYTYLVDKLDMTPPCCSLFEIGSQLFPDLQA